MYSKRVVILLRILAVIAWHDQNAYQCRMAKTLLWRQQTKGRQKCSVYLTRSNHEHINIVVFMREEGGRRRTHS